MPKAVDNSIRQLIIQHREEGESVKKIAEMFRITRGTVINICKRYQQTGSVSPSKPTGRPRLTNPDQDETLNERSTNNPFTSAKVLKAELELPVSLNTVRRRLRESDLGGRRAVKKELLTARNMIDRIGFSYQYAHWNNRDWSSVIFTDEKIFCSEGSGDIWVHRPRGKRFDSRYIYPKRTSGRFSIGVWGWMTAAGPSELLRIDGHLNATKYIDILENSLLPALQMLFGEAVLYFVHDKSPIHMSLATTNWLDQQEKLNAIPWPAKGADMNPIENLWANLTSDPILATTPDEL